MNAALILSGGSGTRFQSALPKQYHRILGKTVIEYSLEAANSARLVDTVMVAGAPCAPLSRLQKQYGFLSVPGGKKRNETLMNGLTALAGLGCDAVVILDAVRPLVTGALLDDYLRLISEG